jgi:hypothetical protein
MVVFNDTNSGDARCTEFSLSGSIRCLLAGDGVKTQTHHFVRPRERNGTSNETVRTENGNLFRVFGHRVTALPRRFLRTTNWRVDVRVRKHRIISDTGFDKSFHKVGAVEVRITTASEHFIGH